jgi:hypothetical protein
MSGRATSNISAHRHREVWRKHEQGTGVRATARQLGIDESSVRYYLAKPRPAGLTRQKNRPRSPAPAPDLIVPGSARTEHIEYDWHLITIRCGGCGHEQETGAESRTSTCKACGRTIRLDHQAAAGQNVVPLRARRA